MRAVKIDLEVVCLQPGALCRLILTASEVKSGHVWQMKTIQEVSVEKTPGRSSLLFVFSQINLTP